MKEPKNGGSDWTAEAKDELSGMAKEGLNHPSTKPVLLGAGIGAVAGALIIGGPILGGLAGAGFALYQRIRK
ncbi:hypothetical protein [Erythrobacter sanguineus]|jgi:hypothetical protein|uniref:Uncharacterized protein n=1 Tax=Erythrobacter sanguineus TaxID=198312 RepID=A0A1M7RSB0_9SPHN|nr:hypothetical protein [Erythrobacter sanguineus]MCR9179717.1 hypothetical protein [Erythrobacteraceae bacterium]SHN49175.1 hypothetical protein SAMN02745193_00290 [Erythrobacter sanguineus]